jgi:ABC-type branched-subunit amino acid transport system substrate-binding protein
VKHSRTRLSILVLLLLVASACSRDEDPETTTGDTTTTTAEDGGEEPSDDATLLANGGFGDLEDVCQDGDASGATAPGVTDTSITVGTVTDKGGFVAGLNEEMYDTAVAFTEWCNEHGGINGRELVLSDVDAKLLEYEPAITEACGRDFALVGGGAVFDEDPNNVRVGCDLPNIAGYVVSARGRTADLQVQPIPNPIFNITMGRYNAAKAQFPDSIDRYAVMASALPSVLLVKQQSIEVAEQTGYELVYQVDYQSQGETGWANFVREMQQNDVKILEFIGQPQNLVSLTQEMELAGWRPDVILLSGNFYDALYLEAGGDIAGNLFIQSVFWPIERASENKATQDYLDLMEQYNPDGKVALLGMQSLSSYLLFAKAAAACGSELTAACLLEEAAAQSDWTAGGLHARQTPGNSEASECMLLLGIDGGEFVVNEEATAATEGDEPFNCDPANVFEMTGDYGVPRPEA